MTKAEARQRLEQLLEAVDKLPETVNILLLDGVSAQKDDAPRVCLYTGLDEMCALHGLETELYSPEAHPDWIWRTAWLGPVCVEQMGEKAPPV